MFIKKHAIFIDLRLNLRFVLQNIWDTLKIYVIILEFLFEYYIRRIIVFHTTPNPARLGLFLMWYMTRGQEYYVHRELLDSNLFHKQFIEEIHTAPALNNGVVSAECFLLQRTLRKKECYTIIKFHYTLHGIIING